MSDSPLGIANLHQVALSCADLDRSLRFYGEQQPSTLRASPSSSSGGPVSCSSARDRLLVSRGVAFDSEPHLIHRDTDGTFGPAGSEEWMAFFRDPDGNVLAIASRAPAASSSGAP
ncbi:MAG: hypothetical protein QNK05_16570 [Myxococcota bacterium]|nr:hypothetical protein [Myxococcota bacterium]